MDLDSARTDSNFFYFSGKKTCSDIIRKKQSVKNKKNSNTYVKKLYFFEKKQTNFFEWKMFYICLKVANFMIWKKYLQALKMKWNMYLQSLEAYTYISQAIKNIFYAADNNDKKGYLFWSSQRIFPLFKIIFSIFSHSQQYCHFFLFLLQKDFDIFFTSFFVIFLCFFFW